MGHITLTLPEIGEKVTLADPRIIAAFQTLEILANGKVNYENLEAEGVRAASILKETITEEKLSSALQKRLGEAVTVGAWQGVTLNAGLEQSSSYQSIGCRQELGANVVRLRGAVKLKAGSTIKATNVLLTLPVGYRPPGTVFVAMARANVPLILIKTTGEVEWAPGNEEVTFANSLFPFDGITFNLT